MCHCSVNWEAGLICIESMCMNSQGRLVGHIRNVRAL